MTLVIVYITTEIHCCTAASCDYGGKTNEVIIMIIEYINISGIPEVWRLFIEPSGVFSIPEVRHLFIEPSGVSIYINFRPSGVPIYMNLNRINDSCS